MSLELLLLQATTKQCCHFATIIVCLRLYDESQTQEVKSLEERLTDASIDISRVDWRLRGYIHRVRLRISLQAYPLVKGQAEPVHAHDLSLGFEGSLRLPLVRLLNLLLLLQKPKANQRVQKLQQLLSKSNFYCSTISKAAPPLLSSAFE